MPPQEKRTSRNEREVQVELEARLKRPVPDAVWELLKKNRHVADVLRGERGAWKDMVSASEDFLRLYDRDEKTPTLRSPARHKQTPSASAGTSDHASTHLHSQALRSQALAELLALEASESASALRSVDGVKLSTWRRNALRNAYPLSPEAADGWIQDNVYGESGWINDNEYGGVYAQPTVYVEIPLSLGEWMRAIDQRTPVSAHIPERTAPRFRYLRIRSANGDVHEFPTLRQGELEGLRQWSEMLTTTYPWTHEDAAWWVLTGIAPSVAPLTNTVRANPNAPELGRFIIQVDPLTSPAELAAYYARARQAYWQEWGGKANQMHARLPDPLRMELVIFVAPRLAAHAQTDAHEMNPPWQTIWQDWTRTHPQETYATDAETMKRNYQRARRQLLGSGRRTTIEDS